MTTKAKRRKVLDIDVNKSTYNQVLFDAVTLNNIDNIRYAISLGARIEDRNNRGQTALDLAVSLGRKPLVDELLRLGADINQKNARDNTCIYEQMKLEDWDMVMFLLSKEDIRMNERNTSGKSYLHLAVSMGNVELVKDLLIMGAAVNMKSNDGRTPLHFAAVHGEIECAKLLIALGGDVNEKDNHNNTPLIFACKYRLDEMVDFLVFREAKVAGQNLDGESALKLVAVHGEGDLMNKMLDSLIEQSKPVLSTVVNELIRIKENMDKVDELGLFTYIYEKLSSDSSFDELVGFEMIVILHSPIKFLNWMIKEDSTGRECHMTKLLLRRFFSLHQERTILRFLLRLNYFTLKCVSRHEIEQKSLNEFADRVEAAIGMLFSADNLDNHTQVLKLLMPEVTQKDHHRLLEFARCFQDEGLLSYCLSNHLKILFDKPQVAGIVEKLFLTPLRETIVPGDISKSFDLKSLRIRRSLFLRSCPAAMYCLDFISKVIAITLVGYISIDIYGKRYGLNYRIKYDEFEMQQLEMWMIIMIITSILHELGELIDNNFSVVDYLQDQWNAYDLLEYGLCLGWMILRFVPGYFNNARIMLALAAIPQSQGLLRYLSVYRPIGELVIIVKAMMVDLVVFLIIYLTSIFGFGIAFAGMFYSPENHTFGTNIQTLLSLFSFTLGNFEFNVFNASSKIVNTMGTLLMMIFITMTAVVLINLLIARMTSSHERVHDQALREWSFSQAQTVSSLLLWTEKNPLSMLPPPFNSFSMLFGILDLYYLPRALQEQDSGISLAGTASNILLNCLVGTILRTIQYMSRTIRKVFGYNVHPFMRILSIVSLLTALVWYPFYDLFSIFQEPDLFFIDHVDEDKRIVYQPFNALRIEASDHVVYAGDDNKNEEDIGNGTEQKKEDEQESSHDLDDDNNDNGYGDANHALSSTMNDSVSLVNAPFHPSTPRTPTSPSGVSPRPLIVYPPSSHLPSPAVQLPFGMIPRPPASLSGYHDPVSPLASGMSTPRLEMVSSGNSITTLDDHHHPSLFSLPPPSIGPYQKQSRSPYSLVISPASQSPTLQISRIPTEIHTVERLIKTGSIDNFQATIPVISKLSVDVKDKVLLGKTQQDPPLSKESDKKQTKTPGSKSSPSGYIDSDDEEIHHRRLQKQDSTSTRQQQLSQLQQQHSLLRSRQLKVRHRPDLRHQKSQPKANSPSSEAPSNPPPSLHRQSTAMHKSETRTLLGKLSHHASSFFVQLSGTGTATAMAMMHQGEGYHLNEVDRHSIGQKLQSTLSPAQIATLENIVADAALTFPNHVQNTNRNSPVTAQSAACDNVNDTDSPTLSKTTAHRVKLSQRRQERLLRRQQRQEQLNTLQRISAAKRSFHTPSHSLRLVEESAPGADSFPSSPFKVKGDVLARRLKGMHDNDKNDRVMERNRFNDEPDDVINNVLGSDQEYESELEIHQEGDELLEVDEDDEDDVFAHDSSQHNNSNNKMVDGVMDDENSGSWEGSLGSSDDGNDVNFIFSIRDVRTILQVFLPSWEPAPDAEASRVEEWKEIDGWVFRVCKAPPAVHSKYNLRKETVPSLADEMDKQLNEQLPASSHLSANIGAGLTKESSEKLEKRQSDTLLSTKKSSNSANLRHQALVRSHKDSANSELSHDCPAESNSATLRRNISRQLGQDELAATLADDPMIPETDSKSAIQLALDTTVATVTSNFLENQQRLHESFLEQVSARLQAEIDSSVEKRFSEHFQQLQEQFLQLQQPQPQPHSESLDALSQFQQHEQDVAEPTEESQSAREMIVPIDINEHLMSLSSQLKTQEETQEKLLVDVRGFKEGISSLSETMDQTLRVEQVMLRRDVANIREQLTLFLLEFERTKKDGSDVKRDVSTLKTGLKRDVVMLKSDFSVLKDDVHSLKHDVQSISRDLAELLHILHET